MLLVFQAIAVALLGVADCRPKKEAALRLQAFRGDLAIQNLFISNPFEADITSNYNATLSVTVVDQDYPSEKPVHCLIEWKAGVGPPDSSQHLCENTTMRVWFPENTFRGVQDYQLQLAHTVVDTSIGECPQYCYLTKYAAVNLTYPEMAQYECDTEGATCEQRVNTTIQAPVYLAVG